MLPWSRRAPDLVALFQLVVRDPSFLAKEQSKAVLYVQQPERCVMCAICVFGDSMCCLPRG